MLLGCYNDSWDHALDYMPDMDLAVWLQNWLQVPNLLRDRILTNSKQQHLRREPGIGIQLERDGDPISGGVWY